MNKVFKKIASCLAVGFAIVTTVAAAVPAQAAQIYGTVHNTQYKGGTFKVYLSPAAQPWNSYIDGSGSEEYHMRQVANAMLPYLRSYGIDYVLAAPKTGTSATQKATLTARANEAKNTGCNLYLAIHSNAGNHSNRGTRIYYYTPRAESKRIANVIASNYIYPDKSNILLATNNSLMELYLPSMPNVLVETAFHDNYQDAYWIQANIDGIAQSLAKSVYDYSKGATGGVPSGVSLDRIMADVPAGTGIVINASNLFTGAKYEYGQVTWTSSNPAVATVDGYGTIVAKTPGTTVVTAHVGGYTASCQVTVP